MLFRRTEHGFSARPSAGKDPLAESFMWGAIANSPKEILKRHLKDHKENPRQKYSERDILDSMDKLRQYPKGDKEVDDILYALSDLAPSDGIRRKARDMIDERRNGK